MSKLSWLVGACLTILLMMSSCKTHKALLSSFQELEGEWTLVELAGEVCDTTEYKAYLVFDTAQKRFSGNAGCNRMSGLLTVDVANPGTIQFGRAMTTRMACPALETEQRFLSAMQDVVSVERVAGDQSVERIAFYDKDKQHVFVLEKK